jgi:epsilon-lactone hydrolase
MGESLSKQQQEELIATLRGGQLDFGADVATLRAELNDVMARVPVADDVDHQPTTIGGVNAIDVTIRGTDSANTILYFHGGVYVIGSAAQSVPLVSDLARRAQAHAVTVDYRLAPEHPYPAAVDDAAPPTRGCSHRELMPATSRSRANRPEVGWRWPHSSRCDTPALRCPAAPS